MNSERYIITNAASPFQMLHPHAAVLLHEQSGSGEQHLSYQ